VFPVSFTCTVKADGPAAVGVPEMVPEPDNDSPAGSAPPISVHWFPPAPPVEESVCEYAVPTVPSGRDAVAMLNARGMTSMESARVSVAPLRSSTTTVKFAVPDVLGVPVIRPVPELMLSPDG
jgi:hypothetical protein